MPRVRLSASFDPEDLKFLRRIRGSAILEGHDVFFVDVLHAALEIASRHEAEVRLVLDQDQDAPPIPSLTKKFSQKRGTSRSRDEGGRIAGDLHAVSLRIAAD